MSVVPVVVPVSCQWIQLFCQWFQQVRCRCRDAADLVVQGEGKFEELMVCSHEIAASTAQLVAASKVSGRSPPVSRGQRRRAGVRLCLTRPSLPSPPRR